MKNEKPTLNENRRSFLKKIGGATASTFAIGAFAGTSAMETKAQKGSFEKQIGSSRADVAFQIRVDAAQNQRNQPSVTHPTNGDEEQYPNFIGNFSKALPHNSLGEVNQSAYNAFLAAIASGNPTDYDAIPLGGTAKLANPQAAVSFHLEGADCDNLAMPAPATIGSTMEDAEMLEVYWHAITRDIFF